ncbi:MAG: permease [Caldisericaceae bacterium]
MNTNIIEGIILLTLVLILYVVYFIRGDKGKFNDASKKSVKMFIQNSIRLFAIFVIIAILEKFLSAQSVSQFLLKFKGFVGIIVGALTGSVMMGPAATSYPIGQYLFAHNASVSLVSAFLFTWVGIGVVAVPLEFKFLGKKFALLRNGFTFAAAILIALVMGVIL